MSQEPLNNQSTTVVSYLNTLNFTYDIVILVAHFTSIVLFLRILYFSHFKPHALRISALSKLLYMFLGTHIVLVLATIPYHIYLLLKWTSQANTAIYDPYVLLLLGVWVDCYVSASSAVAYFIMMDRWMALKFPFKYNTFISAWLLKIAILLVIFVCSASIVYGIIEIPLDMDKVRNCPTFGCVQIRYHHWLPTHIKLLFSALNVLFGGHFIYLIRSKALHTKSRIVRITMIMEVVLNAVPSICTQLFFFATNTSLGNYWGQMVTLLNAVYVALCSIFYWKILAKKASISVFLIKKQTIMTSSSNSVL